jgi:hypothetical protein
MPTRVAKIAQSYPFPWQFDRSLYSDAYLVQRVSEEQVQDAIVVCLEFFDVDVIAIDAGMKRARGRVIAAARTRGIDARELVAFKSGGLPAGFPDLHATLAPSGVSLYIEVKAPAWIDPDKPSRIISEAGKPTLEQLSFLDSKHSRGAIVMVAWSVDDVTRRLGDLADRNRRALHAFAGTGLETRKG